MSHEEERVNGARMQNMLERAPPHWLNPLVGRSHRSDRSKTKRRDAKAAEKRREGTQPSPKARLCVPPRPLRLCVKRPGHDQIASLAAQQCY
jgi:hypothetical protein